MGYGTRAGSLGHQIQTFWPDDTDNCFYVDGNFSSVQLSEILEKAKEKWGEDIDINNLNLEPEYIHTDCLGYDLYDPGDYTRFLCISYVRPEQG